MLLIVSGGYRRRQVMQAKALMARGAIDACDLRAEDETMFSWWRLVCKIEPFQSAWRASARGAGEV